MCVTELQKKAGEEFDETADVLKGRRSTEPGG